MGGHNGATGEGDFDFVPNGAAVTATRNIVVTATCKKCHGPEFAGHGGDRVTVEGCNACHSPNSAMVNSAAERRHHRVHRNGGHDPQDPCRQGARLERRSRWAVFRQSEYRLGRNRRQLQRVRLHRGEPQRYLENGRLPGGARQLPGLPHRQRGERRQSAKLSPPARRAVPAMTRSTWTTGVGHAGGDRAERRVRAPSAIPPRASGRQIRRRRARLDQKDIRNIPEFNIALTTDTPPRGILRRTARARWSASLSPIHADRSGHRSVFGGAGWVK